MKPVLFSLCHYPIHPYSFFLYLAFLSSVFLAVLLDRRSSHPLMFHSGIGVWIYVGAIVGARLFHIIQFGEPLSLRCLSCSGLVFYGGLMGGITGVVLYSCAFSLPPLAVVATAVPALALGEAITRVGCLLNGCCWGTPTGLPWGVSFPRESPAWHDHIVRGLVPANAPRSLPVHPTQMYMSIGLLCLFGLFLYMRSRRCHDATMVCSYFIGYGLLRGFIEHFRGDSAHALLGMTVSQAISSGLALLGIVAVLVLRCGERASVRWSK